MESDLANKTKSTNTAKTNAQVKLDAFMASSSDEDEKDDKKAADFWHLALT